MNPDLNAGSSGVFEILKVLLMLGGVVALAWAMLRFWLPKVGGLRAMRGDLIEVVARQPLEARKTLYVVRAGSQSPLARRVRRGRTFAARGRSGPGGAAVSGRPPADLRERLRGLGSQGHNPMNNQLSNPVVMVIVLGALSLAPFVVIMLTSFVKISVSLSILRNALGTQQVPPSQVITGLSFVLTLFIMSPVVGRMYQAAGKYRKSRDIFSEASVKSLFDAADKGKEPLRKFLGRHAHPKDRMLFMELAARLDQQRRHAGRAPRFPHRRWPLRSAPLPIPEPPQAARGGSSNTAARQG